jgi:ABC-type nitrate/sulfonate/bicarbonate transport system substrate-binding protein/outer membrane protein OmpA-like peptidoglycan-associated protein
MAALVLVVSVVLRMLQTQAAATGNGPVRVTVLPKSSAADTPVRPTSPTPANEAAAASEQLKPLWGPNYNANDGRDTFVCAGYAFSADYVLQQIQMSGLDIKHNFHLGIVPFYLNENYVVTEKNRMAAAQSGQIDCLLTTFDSIALDDPGVITAFINESAGGDQIWARNLSTLNELKGRRIAFEAHGPSEFFVLDLLNTVRIQPNDVQFLPQPNQASAIDAFNRGEADVVAGWEPVIRGAEKGGGTLFASSRDFRSILGAVVISRQATRNKRPVAQRFHDAWFEALDVQQNDFDRAARSIAAWGHNAYTGVSKERAAEDLRGMLGGVAQADLADNARAFQAMPLIVERLRQTRNLWASAGYRIPTNDITAVIDDSYVRASSEGRLISPNGVNRFVNNTFALGRTSGAPAAAQAVPTASAATPAPPQSASPATSVALQPVARTAPLAAATARIPDSKRAVATLPCSRFDFLPDSAELTESAKQTLVDCALPILRQSPTLFLRVKGSSAWPGPRGAFSAADIELTARSRAEAIAEFLVDNGIKIERLFVTWTLPPQDRWETDDLVKQSEDRYVELSLLVAGR